MAPANGRRDEAKRSARPGSGGDPGGHPAGADGVGATPAVVVSLLVALVSSGRNFIVAGNQATCSGRRGSLLLSTTLQKWDATAGKWHAVGAQTRVWRALGRTRYTEVRKKCDNGKYRALFTWVLRNTSGRAVSRLGLTTRSLVAPQGCTITIH